MEQEEEDKALSAFGSAQAVMNDSEEREPANTVVVHMAGAKPRQWIGRAMNAVIALLLLLSGIALGYLLWGRTANATTQLTLAPEQPQTAVTATTPRASRPVLGPVAPTPKPMGHAIQLPESYTLPITYGQLGPALVKAGVIDLQGFLQVFENSGDPLTADLKAIVTTGSDAPVTINAVNAHFLLNFFWAVGLANRNPILLDGPIQHYGDGQADQFASTGGWTLASKPITEVMASLPLTVLSDTQQKRLAKAADAVYRPCCGNSTLFPDCNHGMAMLGILELMAAQDASEDEMLAAAKYVNAFWFPQQTAEAAAYFKLTQKLEFEAIDPRRLVGRDIFSGNGFQSVHQWLADNGHLAQPTEGGNNCGV